MRNAQSSVTLGTDWRASALFSVCKYLMGMEESVTTLEISLPRNPEFRKGVTHPYRVSEELFKKKDMQN